MATEANVTGGGAKAYIAALATAPPGVAADALTWTDWTELGYVGGETQIVFTETSEPIAPSYYWHPIGDVVFGHGVEEVIVPLLESDVDALSNILTYSTTKTIGGIDDHMYDGGWSKAHSYTMLGLETISPLGAPYWMMWIFPKTRPLGTFTYRMFKGIRVIEVHFRVFAYTAAADSQEVFMVYEQHSAA